MTTYAIEITGTFGTIDITDKTTAATWSRSLGEESTTLELDCINLSDNYCMNDVTLTIDGALCFAGTVKEQQDDYDETVKRSGLKCIDNTDKLQRLLVAESFTNQTAKQMIATLKTKYANWIDITNVQNIGGTIETLTFNFDTFAAAIGKLAEITGAYWTIDATNKLYFFLDNRGLGSVIFTANKILDKTFTLDTTATELVNRIWIIGAKQASPNDITQTFDGAGNNQFYSLAYTPNYPTVKENGVNKTIALEKDETPSTDYVYNKKEKVIKRVAGNLPNGVTLQIQYRPTIQVIDYFEDTASIALYGLYEKAIRDKKITDKIAARSRGKAELKRVKKLIRRAKWNSRTWQAEPGQLVRVQLSQFSVDSLWRINSINVQFTPDDIIASLDAEEVDQ